MRRLVLATVIGCVCLSSGVHAESFADKLKRKLDKALAGEQRAPDAVAPDAAANPPAPAAAPANRAAAPANQAAAAPKKSMLGDPDSWCKQQTALLGNKKFPNAKELINQEFQVKELASMHEIFLDGLTAKTDSKAFVSAAYWRNSFETVKVRALYDSFLAFPEPEVLAALIDLSKNSGDAQTKNDARMALAFIHIAVPKASVNPNRWSELVKQAGSEHWTALTFRARLAAYGEGGAKQDIRTAMALLVQAGKKKNEYQLALVRSEWDKNNIETQFNDLAFAVTTSMPGQFPMFEPFNETLMKIQNARQSYMQRFQSTRAGKLALTAAKHNEESAELGKQVLKMSQNANALTGGLASYESMTNVKAGDKQTFANIDPKAEAMLMDMYQQVGELGPEQKKLMEQAQQKRYAAQGLIAEMQSDLFAQFFGGTGGNHGDSDLLVRAGMLAPAMAEAQTSLIRSCIFAAKWEQSLRARNIAAPDKKKAAENLAAENKFE